MAAADGDTPAVIYEAGFGAVAPQLVPGVLILDSVTAGKLDTGLLADDTTWSDISPWVLSATITRASTREQGPVIVYEGGTAVLQLRNDDARFTPENLLGPYVTGGVSQVRPMIPIRVSAVWAGVTYPLFHGFAQAWTPAADNPSPDYDETTLTCADGFLVLAGVTLPAAAAAGAGELSGTRVTRILAAAGWYDAARGMSAVSAGISPVQATTFGASALSLLQVTAASEIGDLFCDAAGRVVFRGRHDVVTSPRSAAVQSVWGDRPGTIQADGTELYYASVTRPAADLTIANDIQATIDGSSNVQQVTDAASVTEFLFARTYQRSDLILQTDPDALAWAQYVAYITGGGAPEFDAFTTIPAASPGNLWAPVLSLEIGNRVQMWRRQPGMTAPITQDSLIRGITHTITAGEWAAEFSLQNAARYSFLVLDDPVLGQLDANAVAF